ncbi:MAG: hypothetical protein J07AB43_06190, partial [Candidatus Nanosalina sp. J07AB43]
MVHEPKSESLEEAFRKHKKRAYRPHPGHSREGSHPGPSGKEFEVYKEAGQER